MEMRFLVDRLEAIVNAGRRIGFGRILLEEGELLEIVDQMHVTEPTEINQARRVILEREQILTQAQIEADSIITMARDRVNNLLSEDGLTREAKAYAEQLLSEALQEARKTRADADEYATDILVFIEDALEQNLAQVRRGLEHLRSQR
ncbi:MAG: ATPase [Chloroflexi bacterium]|nr:ATPase [Chloroflexota bacterium]